MKGGLAAFVCVFCIAILIVSVVNAKKPPKPPGGEKPECILFTEDLQSAGETIIVGCCPNGGPWPEYDMILDLGVAEIPYGVYHGYLFMNSFGKPAPYQGYKVQFWTWDYETEDPGDGDYFFEIRGGVIEGGKKGVPLTVTFTNETATGWEYFEGGDSIQFDIPEVSFVLLRSEDLSYCGG